MITKSDAVLISIHKEYSDKIFNGIKRFEFRKKAIGKNTKRIYVYESRSNINDKILGYFLTSENIEKKPVREILHYIKNNPIESGIDYKKAEEYYRGYEYGYMYPILKVKKYRINQYEIFGEKFKPPQSFLYIDKKTENKIINIINKNEAFK